MHCSDQRNLSNQQRCRAVGFPFSTSLHESELRGEDRSNSVLSFYFAFVRSGWRTFKGQPLIPNVTNVTQHCSGQIYSIEAQRCTARAKIASHKRELHVSLQCIALHIIIEAQSCMVETIIASHVKIELNMHDSSSRWSWNLASRVHFLEVRLCHGILSSWA